MEHKISLNPEDERLSSENFLFVSHILIIMISLMIEFLIAKPYFRLYLFGLLFLVVVIPIVIMYYVHHNGNDNGSEG